MITKSTINAIRRHGLDRMHEEWLRKQECKKHHGRLAAAFEELVGLDLAGTLLERSENDRKHALNALRPGSFPTFGQNAVKGHDDDRANSYED